MRNNFRRKTASNNFIPEIDGLRFLAIITVVLFHINTAITKEIGFGLINALDKMGGAKSEFSLAWWWVRLDLGVKVFFAISGFVLALPFLKFYLGLTEKRVEIGPYFIRRLTRLEPPFIITLLVFYFVHIFILDHDSLQYLKHLGAGLIYSHVFIFGEGNPINPVTWSLETEAQFYILVPLVLWLMFRFRNNWSSLLFIVILITTSILFRNKFNFSPHIGRSIFSYFVNFAMGILVCWIYLRKSSWFIERTLIYDLIGLFSTLGLFYFYKPQHEILNQLLFNLSIVGVIVTAFKGKLSNWFYTQPIIYIIGGMCYSIYLIHYAFLHLSVKFTKYIIIDSSSYLQNLVIQVIVNLLLVLLVSSAFFVLVEKPTMDKNWPKNLLNKFKKAV
jgi:peptidoglycan/LPS O-acetylase OafA/YrhL